MQRIQNVLFFIAIMSVTISGVLIILGRSDKWLYILMISIIIALSMSNYFTHLSR